MTITTGILNKTKPYHEFSLSNGVCITSEMEKQFRDDSNLVLAKRAVDEKDR
jgi:hypothetical protein